MATSMTDSSWLRHAFMLPIPRERTGFGAETQRRYATSAAYKFTNTTLGGNWAINNPPQFTRYADIRHPGKGRTETNRQDGMGDYYSRAIDDPGQVVHMTFGVPQYSGLTSFFTNFYDRNMALLANTGRTDPLFYNLGLVGGFIVSLPLQPFIIGATAASRVYNFLTRQRPSKWYYFKPTMHAYWSAVNTIANELTINLGLAPRVMDLGQKPLEAPGQQVTEADSRRMHEIFPKLFRADGGVDIMALANRTQRMGDAAQRALTRMQDNATNLDELRQNIDAYVSERAEDPKPDADARQYFQDYINSGAGKEQSSATETFSEWGSLGGVKEFITASQRDGSQFATFRVNHAGSMSESFSNSTRESDIAQTLNQRVQQGRSTSFNIMGGNVNEIVGSFLNAGQSLLAGGLDSVNLGGLATLAGTAFLDIPKLWDGSTANLPRAEYTVPLPSAYGNKISRFMNLYIPLSMLLAAALPRSAGRSAYTSPFLCQIFHQGRVQIQLGMIDSLTITRGTGNVGWNADHDMLGAEVSFSVVDMSSIMHVPIKGSFGNTNLLGAGVAGGLAAAGGAVAGDTGEALALAGSTGAVWDEQSLFQDYMAVLGSLPASDAYYVSRRLNLNLTRVARDFNTWRSPSNFMSWVLDSAPARGISAFAQTSDRF